MASTSRSGSRPTKHYFAYGSNLHIMQMKRRCPNSRYIGRARLSGYRWQINERGYANVVEAEGQWVDGLVYEIDEMDEARLDINEGVVKNAYAKRHMTVLLHRAPGALYRLPVSWIVDKGGPAAVCRQISQRSGQSAPEDDVLVYISFNHTQDGAPKDEYVDRLNLGLTDARALGVEDDYIRNCIRPLIPEPPGISPATSTQSTRAKAATRGVKRSIPPRTGEPSPARKGQVTSRPDQQTPRRALVRTTRNPGIGNMRDLGPASGAPPAPLRIFYPVSAITVEEYVSVGEWESRPAI